MYSTRTAEVSFPSWEVDDCVDASSECNYDCCWVEAAFRAVYDLHSSTLTWTMNCLSRQIVLWLVEHRQHSIATALAASLRLTSREVRNTHCGRPLVALLSFLALLRRHKKLYGVTWPRVIYLALNWHLRRNSCLFTIFVALWENGQRYWNDFKGQYS